MMILQTPRGCNKWAGFPEDPGICKMLGWTYKLAPLRKPLGVVGGVCKEVAGIHRTGRRQMIIVGTGTRSGLRGLRMYRRTYCYAHGGTAGIVAEILPHCGIFQKMLVLGTRIGVWVMEGVANASGSAFKWFKEEFVMWKIIRQRGLVRAFMICCVRWRKEIPKPEQMVFSISRIWAAQRPRT